MTVRVFTEYEDDIIRRGFRAGLSDAEIAAQLVGRHKNTVGGRRRQLKLFCRRRRRGFKIDKTNPLTAKGYLRISAGPHAPSPEAPPASIAERDRAYLAPRTIEQQLLGDPLPGRSYLDRMKAREAAQGERHKLSSRHSAWSPRAW